MTELITQQVKQVASERGITQSQAIRVVEREYFAGTPDDQEAFLRICESMIATTEWVPLSVATLWLRRREDLHTMRFFPVYESWITQYALTWSACDALCNRVVNYVVYNEDEAYEHLIEWTKSPRPFVRRAAAVALIEERDNFIVRYNIDQALHIATLLIGDTETYVHKGVGWLLKAASKVYPDAVVAFLRTNVRELPRLVFRYALEKMPADVRAELMAL